MVAIRKMLIILPEILVVYQALLVSSNVPVSSIPDKIIVGASLREPFVVFDTQTKTSKGSDVTILKEFGKRFNISMEFVKLDVNLTDLLNSKELFERFIQNENIR